MKKIIDSIVWDGANTNEVVEFCCKYCYDLCHIHTEFINSATGIKTLEIEPADIMRHSCFDIPLGSTVLTDGRFLKIQK